ncbi:transport protein [Paucilactobacillus suebicus DSM 5007 = KCTC 3549]|uniref:Transport protein n=1 Tax=Paucilactobacillus suebicus DSM 5007 = KCTC 3549 TaxID=1423807 RepID=A0A0R1W793_9LACO|nr:transport protein [Paucilactobacillus suebicus DSM 5007 = KCTC 3549]
MRVKLAILSAGLLSFVGILVETSMNVTFPTLIKELHVSLSTVQWLTTGYLLLVTIVMSTTAYVMKRFDAKNIFIFAASFSLIGGILALVAPNFWILLVGRLIQAIATGLSTPLMFNLIFAKVPKQKLGVYSGMASVVISLAPALGPTYGGILTSIWSWRAIFIGVIPIIIIVGFFGISTINEKAIGIQKGTFDYIGAIALAIVFTSILLTFDQAGNYGWYSIRFWIGVILSVLFLGIFLLYANKGRRKLLDYRILKLPLLRLRLFNYFSLQLINIGMSFVLPLFAQTVLHCSAMQAGLMMLPGSLIGAITGPIAGRFYDQHGAFSPLLTSSILMLVGTLGFFFMTKSLTVMSTTFIYVVMRIGFNTGFGTAISDGSLQVSFKNKADQNSLFSMMQQYAGSLGTNVLSVVISATIVMHADRSTVINTMNGSHMAFLAVSILGILVLCSVIYAEMKYGHQRTDN